MLAGDGVGPEVIVEAQRVVDALGLPLEWTELPWGSAYWHEHGRMMPEDALDVLRAHDACLMGAVGDPSVPDHVSLWGIILADPPETRPLGQRAAGTAAGRDPLPPRRPRAGGRRHALRAGEHRG